MSQVIPEVSCPHCGCKLNRTSPGVKDGGLAKPGDISICVHCGMVLVFTEGMTQRLASVNDLAGLDYETFEQIARIQQGIAKLRAQEN